MEEKCIEQPQEFISQSKEVLPCDGISEEVHGFFVPPEIGHAPHASGWHMKCSIASWRTALGGCILQRSSQLDC